MFDKNIISINFQTAFVSFFILGISLFRLIPQMNNFSPILALAIFGALNFRRNETTYLVLILSLWLSDLIINNYIYNYSNKIIWFYEGFYWQYISYIIIIYICINFDLIKKKIFKVLFLIFSSSIIFFALSNFGYWLTSEMYQNTFQGLINCYIAAIPFYKGTLLAHYSILLCYLYCIIFFKKRFSASRSNNLIFK